MIESEFEAVMQINGKIRARMNLAMNIADADFEKVARETDAVDHRHLCHVLGLKSF